MIYDKNIPNASRRSGGREARRSLRAAPLARDLRPVRAGLEGGQFKPLDAESVKSIDVTVYQILEEIGLSQAPESGIKYMTDAGAVLGDDGRVRFPRALVEDTLSKCARNINLYGQNSKHDLLLSGSRVHYGTAGAAVHVVDVEKNEYREADIYDAARIVDQMDNIHFFQRPMVARSSTPQTLISIRFMHRSKALPNMLGAVLLKLSIWLLFLICCTKLLAVKKKWRARPFVSNSNCFVVPPLRFATESCLVMEEAVRNGMPVLLLSAGQAGATAPASIAGAVAQALSEVIAGLIYVNAMQAGHPCICGTWPFVSDLRTGAMSGGSGEQGLLTAACAQMLQFYDLPGGAAAGMADSKMPDAQSGYEKGSTLVMAGLSGLNMVYEAAGMHASLLGFCLDSLIIDNDMLGQCLRCVRGIEVNESTLGVQVMKDVCMGGPGHYLGHDQTITLMQTEYIYPEISDRSSPKEWEELGKPNLLDNARKRKEEILQNYHPNHISKELDAELRSQFKISL